MGLVAWGGPSKDWYGQFGLQTDDSLQPEVTAQGRSAVLEDV